MIRLRDIALPGFLLLCLLLGGASAAGYVANLSLQFAAIVLILWALSVDAENPFSGERRILSSLAWIGSCLVMLQFLPVPMALWHHLGGRDAIAQANVAAGLPPPYPFLTLMPHESLKSAVSVLPPLAIILASARLNVIRPLFLAWAVVAAMVLSVLLGTLQLAGGNESPFYFYQITDYGSTVGFFANSNHLATLLLVSLPFIGAIAAQRKSSRHARNYAQLAMAGLLLVIAIAGIAVNGSLAGYILLLPVLAASAALPFPRLRLPGFLVLALSPAIVAGAFLLSAESRDVRILASSDTISVSAREEIFRTAWQAIPQFLPTGTGLGSFAEIYRQFEDPAAVGSTYVNHAHNDYLELIFETGLPGAIFAGLFLAWWGYRAVRIYRDERADPIICAAVIASATILVHSIVDYPLRTTAIASVFALCCVLMTAKVGVSGAVRRLKRKIRTVDQWGEPMKGSPE